MARYPLRTAFMMLGSLVGVAALTFVVSVSRGAQTKMMRTVRQIIGDGSVLVIGGGSRMMGAGTPRAAAARLTIDDIAAVAREVPDVEAWDPQADLPSTTVRHGDATATVRVLGASERFERVWGRGVSRGRPIDAAAVAGSARVALIGETAARRLFGSDDPIDAEIRVGAVPFRVIGVLEAFGTDMHGMDRDNEIVVPVTTAMRRLANVDAIGGAKLVLRDPERADAVAREVRRVLRARHGIDRDRPNDFVVITSLQVQRTMAMVRRALVLYVPLVAAVVLLAGGVVAAMLMLASVNQRVGEIGLRRAVGARPEDIGRQFVVETTATMIAGGVAGIALAYVGVSYVVRRMHLGTGFSWQAVLLGVVAAAATGLLASVIPARRAARLHPVEALRS
jgi:putative ABC transport system permease protein